MRAGRNIVCVFCLALGTLPVGAQVVADYLLLDSVTHRHVPNMWLHKNNLPLLDPDVLLQDPDGDGFLNEDEWRHGTDPNDPASHPPYYTKLFLVRRLGQPLEFTFQSIDGDPAKADAAELTFQVNLRQGRLRSQFIKVGARFDQTDWTLVRAAIIRDAMGVHVGSLTLQNRVTGQELDLSMGKPRLATDGQALLRDDLVPRTDLPLHAMDDFTLKSEPAVHYRLLSIQEDGALIQLPNGQHYLAPFLGGK